MNQFVAEQIDNFQRFVFGNFFLLSYSLTENFDRLAVKTTVTMPPTTEKKSASWFKIRNKENKNKNTIVMDSPSKDLNNFDATASNPDATNASGSAIESLLLNKQTIQEKVKALGLDFFSEDFEGVTASSIQCLACETTTEQKETMIDLSVPITENMETHELTDSFIQVSFSSRIVYIFIMNFVTIIPHFFF